MPTRPVVAVLHDGDPPSQDALAPVLERAEVRMADEAGLAAALDGAEVMYAYHFLSRVMPEVWHAAGSLRWLHVAAAGVDALLTPEVAASDVVVTNSRGIFDASIAEYVLGQVLAFAKDLPGSVRRQDAHTWEHRESDMVAGSRALVIGTGPIGRSIARLLRAAGVEVSGSGRRARTGDPDLGDVTDADGLPAALAAADWVVLAAPLTPATRGMIDAAALSSMKPTARLVNVGRGELVRTDDLVTALREGTIAGAALDVVDPEPLPAGHPLWDLPGAIITPHNSGDFRGWRDALTHLFADNFLRWTAGEPLPGVVDKSRGYVPGEGS
ncbi:D-2-hydroxyacid dehydrogenase [Georgenia sp. Z1344]|uniref:D-2-hydroxyacid dehydrogenase n=1 Tax=Georgenia sp. Z1344 TaxID=3416706 RepID=UPI003CF76EFA